MLSDPVFWATQLSLGLGSDDDVEKPNEAYFGVSTDEVNRYYRDVIDSKLGAGSGPTFAFRSMTPGSSSWNSLRASSTKTGFGSANRDGRIVCYLVTIAAIPIAAGLSL